MSNYDEYFTDGDKPFAENLNDALLLSNVFDLTVPIELPLMFNNKSWVNTTSPRKAGVSIVTLDELMNGITIGTDEEDNSILTATEDTAFGFYFYPNFNSFGKIKSIEWEGAGNITIDLYTNSNELITENISQGIIAEGSVHLRELKPILFVINMPQNSVLNAMKITMDNTEKERYGAEVGISDVNGLETSLEDINGLIDDEVQERINAVSTLQGNINSEASTRLSRDNVLQTNITAEANTRSNADTALSNRISNLEEDTGWINVSTSGKSSTVTINQMKTRKLGGNLVGFFIYASVKISSASGYVVLGTVSSEYDFNGSIPVVFHDDPVYGELATNSARQLVLTYWRTSTVQNSPTDFTVNHVVMQ